MGANFTKADCNEGNFIKAGCEGVSFYAMRLKGAAFNNITIDESTDFSVSNLEASVIEPGIRAKLEQNIRRFHWRKWYE